LASTKISAGADPVTLVASDKIPVARNASTTAYAATMTELAVWTNSGLPYSAVAALAPGIASAGTLATVSRGDHVHPFDGTRLSTGGGTLTGGLIGTTAQFTSYIVGASGPTWTAGTGVPATTQPRGSLFSRTDGAVGSTLYVSQGGGTWNPIAAV